MSNALNIDAANPNAPRIEDSVPAAPSKPSLAGMSKAQLREAVIALGVDEKKSKMRAQQLWGWIYNAGVRSFDDMTNVSKALRAQLAEAYTLDRPRVIERLVSKDGTRKYLIELAPGVECETVFIPNVSKTGALCVSSQVGCTLNCTFCHTGTQAMVRNLTAAEIVTQVMIARDDVGEWPTTQENRQITNIVFMGMGEPLYNVDNVADSIDILSNEEGMAIGRRRITVSTSGVVPRIKEIGERTNAMLAISLHATNDALRDELVPLNKKYPLDQLFDAIRSYPSLSNSKRVTFEYVMLKGVNDSLAEARALIKMLQDIPAKINLIPFNPWPGSPYECSDYDQIEKFADLLNAAGFSSPIRTPRGRDIFAACGQLKSESEKVRASVLRKQRLQAEQANP